MRPLVRRAVLLAAGRGTRLRPLTDDKPKPLLPVGGRPLIEHSVRMLVDFGVQEIFINLHHAADAVMAHFGDGTRFGIRIRYSIETELLGTSGGVKRMTSWLRDEPFFVWYGDNLCTCRLDALVERHAASQAMITMALFWKEDVTPHSAVQLLPDDRIVRFVEKPKANDAPSHWISAGVNVMEPAVLDAIPERVPNDFGFDVFPSLLREGHAIQGYRMGASEGLWWIDTPEHYRLVSELWKTGAPRP